MSSVTLSRVFKRYGAAAAPVTAVRDLNLEIRDKEFMVLVGPSGCGKTTALRMIAGLEEISDGTIAIGERVVNNVEPRDRDIAMVFQNYALYPHMSVFENMAFGLRLRRVPKEQINTRVNEAARQLDLEQYLQRKPGALSGGQRQRVALGRAIVREPQVFLMDEPLSNLDAKLRVQTRSELIKLHRRLGITTIYVTHDQVEAMTMGDRMAVMRDGVLQQCDTPINIFNMPVNMFVAGFVGTPSMNFLPGTLRKTVNGYFAELAEGLSLPVAMKAVSPSAGGAASVDPFAAYIDKTITVGVRPSDVQRAETGAEGIRGIRTQVDVVEPMGDVSTLYLTAPGRQQIVATLNADVAPQKEGEILNIVVDPLKVRLFDPATEQALYA